MRLHVGSPTLIPLDPNRFAVQPSTLPSGTDLPTHPPQTRHISHRERRALVLLLHYALGI